jgi:hypothetical protein
LGLAAIALLAQARHAGHCGPRVQQRQRIVVGDIGRCGSIDNTWSNGRTWAGLSGNTSGTIASRARPWAR